MLPKSKHIIAAILMAVAIFRCPPAGWLSPNIGVDDVIRVMFISGMLSIMGVVAAKENLWVGLLLFVTAFSFMFPMCTMYSLHAAFMVVLGVGLYLSIIKEFEDYSLLLKGMVVFTLIHVYFLIGNYFGLITDIYGTAKQDFVSPVGLMGNQNSSAAAIALCLPAFFNKSFIYLLPIPLLGLVISDASGGALGAALAGGIYVSLVCKNKLPILSAIILLFIGFMLLDTPCLSHRLSIWKPALLNHFTHKWGYIPHQTLTGVGIGNWPILKAIASQTGFETNFTRLHNTFIQGFVEMGFPFLLVLTGYVVNIIRRINKHSYLALSALGAITATSMANSTFQFNLVNGMFVIIWLAILEINLRRTA